MSQDAAGNACMTMAMPNKALKMYNLNVNVAATTLGTGALLGIDGQCTTPRTPEILNSLIAMSNPFDSLVRTGQENTSPLSEECTSNATSPLGSPCMSPPSVQTTCSQLIKEGLKLTLQSKRKLSGSESKDEMDDFLAKRSKSDELTAEDEERRKRRRERNKIAATKCRLKKREKTANLVTESEVLETQNIEMKTQIKDLEKQRRTLEEMLSHHACVRRVQIDTIAQQPAATAPPLPPPPLLPPIAASAVPAYDIFSSFLPSQFAEDAALISLGKDPNLFDSIMQQDKVNRIKSGVYRCDEDDVDIYRPNGILDSSCLFGNDSGYSSFNATTMDGCRA